MDTLKEEAIRLISQMPEPVDIDEIMYRLYVIDKVRKGKDASSRGRPFLLRTQSSMPNGWLKISSKKRSRAERLQAMEVLWDSLLYENQEIDPPEWHEEVLEERDWSCRQWITNR